MSDFFDRRIAAGEESSNGDEHAHSASSSPRSSPDADAAPSTLAEVKKAIQELLKHGYLEAAQKRELFHRAIIHEREIAVALEPLDLALRLDTHRGVAYLVVAPSAAGDTDTDDAWMHPLVRRQRLTLEQSLLVALLRQAFVIHEQESGVGQRAAKVAVDDLLPQCITYFGDSGSDAKNETRLLNLLEQLKPHGIVSEVDKQHEITIRPLIAHLANPESLAALLAVLKNRPAFNGSVEREP